MTTKTIRSHLARTRLLLAALTCMLGLFACTLGGRIGSGSVLQQDWDKRRGPVGPHDNFPLDCALCHEGGSWNKIRPDFVFDHEKETGTPLRGAHAVAECLRCHNDRGPVAQFSQQGCVGCHEDIHRGKQGSQCSTCHNESDWVVNDAISMHSRTRFPLFGVHASTECWRCHPGAQVGNFDRAPIDCANCHQAQLQSATNPDHVANGWTSDCQRCHFPVSWGQGDFDHSWYPLIGKHRSPPRQCTDCHVNSVFQLGAPNTCLDCHGLAATINPVVATTTNPVHSAAGFDNTDCATCHTAVDWQPANYVHTWPLTGLHTVGPRTCNDCHASGVHTGYQSAGYDQCVDCHLTEYNATSQPAHAAAGYPTTCSNCHDTTSFLTAVFNHDTWPLTGTHRQVNCDQCHLNNNYTNAPTLCYGCHQTDYDGTSTLPGIPDHPAAQMQHTCEDCHTTVHWTPVTFTHPTTPLVLSNAHAVPPRTCTQCHLGGVSVQPPTNCVGCHGAAATVNPVYNGSSNTMHVQMGGNPLVCTQCHNTTLWQPPTFDHSNWPLTGMHLPPNIAACSACHASSNYAAAPTACSGCHMADYNGTNAPPHLASNFPTTCQTCHTTAGWTGATFNHSWWPLAGAHTVPPRQCTDCHGTGVYHGTPTTCVSCHLANYQGTTNPNHTTANFPTTCQNCHSTVDWTGATFDHSVWYPLVGQHQVPPRACVDCHTTGVYGQMPTTCISCHAATAPGTPGAPTYGDNPPNHQTLHYPNTCEACHNQAGPNWLGASFNHSSWPLTGAHIATACALCHIDQTYAQMPPTACSGCHGTGATIDPQYASTNAPPHATNPNIFTQQCQTCHTTTAWTGATIAHNNVGFALAGAHVSPPLACIACHTGTGSAWHLNSTTCDSCHHADWTGTTNPSHSANGIPLLCGNCHSTATGWVLTTMNHTGVTGACSNCHTPDFNATTNPDHEVQGYPMTCTGSGAFTCHTSTTSWTPNGFNPATTHDNRFPLPHHNSRCNQCHITVQVFTAFSCISGGCHPQSTTNSHHNGVSNYQYNSAACYNCHPNGQAGLTGNTTRRPGSPSLVRLPHIRPNRRAPAQRIPGTTAPPPQAPGISRP